MTLVQNAKRKRKFRVSPNQPTPLGSVPDISCYRGQYGQWPMWTRLYLAGKVRSVMTWQEDAECMLTGKMPDTPNSAARLKLAYQDCFKWCQEREAEEAAAAAAAAAAQESAAPEVPEPADAAAASDSDSEDEGEYEWDAASAGSSASERSDDVDWDDSASEADSENSSIHYVDALPDAEADAAAAAELPEQTDRAPLSYEMVKEVAKKYCKRLCQHQTVANIYKNTRGYKLRKHRALLTIVKDMIVDCWRDDAGNRRMFKNLDEVEKFDAAYRQKEIDDDIPVDERRAGLSFAEVKAQMKVSNRTMWHQLKALFKMRRMRLMLKRKRDESKVKRFAEMVLNLRDVEFAQYYNDPVCREAAAHVLKANFKFRWHHRYGYKQWWLDAVTMDPHKLLEHESGIWLPGLEQFVVQTDLTNAGLGTVPSVQVYLAVHAVHGTRLYFPDKGLKRGSKGNREGCDTWTTTLTAGQREFIKAAAYYNMDKAVDKLAQKRSGKRKDAFETGVFSADNFLTTEGNDPKAVTSAEFAAMFDMHIMPDLRSFYEGKGDFDQQCQDFAKLIGRESDWRNISFPAFISLDNATIHVWARKLMCVPRVHADEINARVSARIESEFSLPAGTCAQYEAVPRPAPPPPPPEPSPNGPAQNLQSILNSEPMERAPTPEPPVQPAPAPGPSEAQQKATRIAEEKLNMYKIKNGADLVQVVKREMAETMEGMRCLVPEQFMPLCEVTPDVHSPIEHMVGTIKRYVKSKMREQLTNRDALLSARSYQVWLREAVAKKGNGPDGLYHINRSIEKQKCICQILATPRDKIVEVTYTFKWSKHKPKWRVRGSAGAWIYGNKWS